MSLSMEQEIRNLEEVCDSYEFSLRLMELSEKGESGDNNSVILLSEMLKQCVGKTEWFSHNRWCSMTLKALMMTRTPESLKIIMQFIRNLPEQMPFGAVDLLSSLLPLYRGIITGHVIQLASEGESEVLRALGMQTLCNLYLEGLLNSDHVVYLENLMRSYKGDRYFTQQVIDITRSALIGNRKADDIDLSDLTEDITLNDELMTLIQGEL
jgi:hypothetical protein